MLSNPCMQQDITYLVFLYILHIFIYIIDDVTQTIYYFFKLIQKVSRTAKLERPNIDVFLRYSELRLVPIWGMRCCQAARSNIIDSKQSILCPNWV